MTRPRLGLLSLCAVVLGLMAVSASAQASKWLVLNASKEVKTGTQLPGLMAAELETGTVHKIIGTVLGIDTKVVCTAVTLNSAKLEAEGAITNGFKIKFSGCTVELNGVLNKECEAHTLGSPVGTVETLPLKGQLQLAESEGTIVIEPKTGTAFVTIEMGAGCPVGNKIPVTGVLDLKDCEKLMETHLVKHLMKQSLVSRLKMFGVTAAFNGSSWWFLAGEHAGLLWGGDKE